MYNSTPSLHVNLLPPVYSHTHPVVLTIVEMSGKASTGLEHVPKVDHINVIVT